MIDTEAHLEPKNYWLRYSYAQRNIVKTVVTEERFQELLERYPRAQVWMEHNESYIKTS